jgi:hypothetical protein
MNMKRQSLLLFALLPIASFAADRAIVVNPTVAQAWAFSTGGPTVISGPAKGHALGVGFWQRASGAKPGVGENFVTSVEFQLPESAPNSIRSASYQFSGKASQCLGAEPVVIDVYAYAGDGKAAIADANAGTRVAQMSADCKDSAAFARPIDVSAMVRQLSAPSGLRYLGLGIRKANNRQGPSLFTLAAGKLTVVVTDLPVAGAAPSHAAAPTQRAAVTTQGRAPGATPAAPAATGLKRAGQSAHAAQ